MGAWGAIIMSFFGAVFASLTLASGFGWKGMMLGVPFAVFAAIALSAAAVIRRPGEGITPSKQAERVILWSSIGEGIGLFVAANLVTNLGHREMLLPAMALVVGLHFLPMARAIPFRPFYALGVALLAAAAFGLAVGGRAGATVSGFAAAGALWTAALVAVRRELKVKSGGSLPVAYAE